MAYQFRKSDDYRKRACYARMIAGHGRETEKILEAGASEQFLAQAEQTIRKIERKNHEAMRRTTSEAVLQSGEKKYGKISCIL